MGRVIRLGSAHRSCERVTFRADSIWPDPGLRAPQCICFACLSALPPRDLACRVSVYIHGAPERVECSSYFIERSGIEMHLFFFWKLFSLETRVTRDCLDESLYPSTRSAVCHCTRRLFWNSLYRMEEKKFARDCYRISGSNFFFFFCTVFYSFFFFFLVFHSSQRWNFFKEPRTRAC